jgi:hypothetical protein
VVLLGLLGAGLGIYTPANNAEIMAAVPARDAASAGGMVNMTRGVGTALGVAVVTLGLHAGALARSADAGRTAALAALAVVALAGTWAGQRGSRTAPGAVGPESGGLESGGPGSGALGSGGPGSGGPGSGGPGSGGPGSGGPR